MMLCHYKSRYFHVFVSLALAFVFSGNARCWDRFTNLDEDTCRVGEPCETNESTATVILPIEPAQMGVLDLLPVGRRIPPITSLIEPAKKAGEKMAAGQVEKETPRKNPRLSKIRVIALAVFILMLIGILSHNPTNRKAILRAGFAFVLAVLIMYFIYGLR